MADFCRASRQFLLFRPSSRILLPGLKNRFQALLLSTEASISEEETPIYRKPWRVFVAVLLQRRPIISKLKTDIEKRFEVFQEQLELEHSALSDYEFRKIKVRKASQMTKKKLTEAEEQKRIEFEREFAKLEDEEQSIKEEIDALTFADRLSPSEHEETSLERKFDESLHLAVKSADEWLLPETEVVEGETLKQAAERVLNNQYKAEIPALYFSNAPAGVHTIELSSAEKRTSDYQGKKIFFYKVILQPQKESLPPLDTDFKWITFEEMKTTIPSGYLQQINKFA